MTFGVRALEGIRTNFKNGGFPTDPLPTAVEKEGGQSGSLA